VYIGQTLGKLACSM